MVILFLILALLSMFIIGFYLIHQRYQEYERSRSFTFDFREKFILFSNGYFETYNSFNRNGRIDNESYMWLVRNMDKMQREVGSLGLIYYQSPFQRFQSENYPVILNTIPKYRQNSIDSTDVHLTDDCLMRYLGSIEASIQAIEKKRRNPIIWFKEGFHEVMSLPILILSWFGIISSGTARNFTSNIIYKFISGISGLIALVASIVTIIQGKEALIKLVNQLF